MALLWIDGFDAYGLPTNNYGIISPALDKAGYVRQGIDGNDWVASTDTRTGVGWSLTGNSTHPQNIITNFKTSGSVTVGFALKVNAGGFNPICFIGYNDYNGNIGNGFNYCGQPYYGVPNSGDCAEQIKVYSNGSNGVTVRTEPSNSNDGGTFLAASSPNVLFDGVWQYMEIEYTPGLGTTGTLEVRLDNVTIIYIANGVTMDNVWPAYVNFFGFEITDGNAVIYDDLYILDNTTSSFNTFLGDCVVHAIFPNSDAGPNTMAVTGGVGSTHYTAIDENPPNMGVSYVSSNTSGQAEHYGLSAFPNDIIDVLAMSVCVLAEKTAPGIGFYESVLVYNGVEVDSPGPGFSAPMTWCQTQFTVTAPPGGGTWSLAACKAAQIGVKIP